MQKLYELRFNYWSSKDDNDTEGEFSILCRASNKKAAIKTAREHLTRAALPPNGFLSDIPGLSIDLDWIFEINDIVDMKPAIIGHTEHEGSCSCISANNGDLAGTGIRLYYWEDPDYVAPSEGPLKGSTSAFFWRPIDEDKLTNDARDKPKDLEVPDWLDQFGREATKRCETTTPAIRWSAGYEDDYECWCMEIWPALMLADDSEGNGESTCHEHFQRIDITGILSVMDPGSQAELSDATNAKEGSHLLFNGTFAANRVMLRIFHDPREDDEPLFRMHEDGTIEQLFDNPPDFFDSSVN